jgi:hypothetical protein
MSSVSAAGPSGAGLALGPLFTTASQLVRGQFFSPIQAWPALSATDQCAGREEICPMALRTAAVTAASSSSVRSFVGTVGI